MARRLEALPTEILDHVLQHLSLADLLSFARTSKLNYGLSVQALTSLDLAILPRKIHSLLAFFDTSEETEEEDAIEGSASYPPTTKHWARRSHRQKKLYQVGLTTPYSHRPKACQVNNTFSKARLPTTKEHKHDREAQIDANVPPTPLALRTAEIAAQNDGAFDVLSARSLSNLRSLTLRLYDLTCSNLATTIATSFPHLQALTLDFSHSYIHDTTLPARYWKETALTGSPIWNILSGVGPSQEAGLRLRNLHFLRLDRSGITSFQLRHWITANPELRELRLSLCRGVDKEFVVWLGKYISSGQSKLEVVRLTQCGLLELQKDRDFAWVSAVAASNTLKELNLLDSRRVNEEVFLRFALAADRQDRDEAGAALLDDSDGEDDVDSGQNLWSGIQKLVSPRGIVIRQREHRNRSRSRYTHVKKRRVGSVSPALKVSDDMLGCGSSPSSGGGFSSNSGGCCFGKIEVDTTFAL